MDPKAAAKVKAANDAPIVKVKVNTKEDKALSDYLVGNMSIWNLFKFKR
tara:strand:- start:609 stop:755 length:147 start_codon:yes stop_codon:yes gene_type:complete